MTTQNFNLLSCPQCCNLLTDYLPEYEKNSEVKTVKCTNTGCDYIGKRIGFQLLSLQDLENYNLKKLKEQLISA